jgi:hypothetical protein
LLGFITNEKPSAIFKISNLKKSADPNMNPVNSLLFGQPGLSSAHNAQIGISIEPLDVILQSTPAAMTDASRVSSFVEFTTKMLENFVNYVNSFGDTNNISVQTVNNWYSNFKRRLEADPNFWR